MSQKLIDRYGRSHNYLRISVTDRCNLRCFYCMGPDGVPLLEREQILKYEEILEVVKVGAELGITGGEPLVMTDLCEIIELMPIGSFEEHNSDKIVYNSGLKIKEVVFEVTQIGKECHQKALSLNRWATV